MNLADVLRDHPRTLSFEFFPPKDAKGEHLLEDTILALSPIGPHFASVTDKVGGSVRERTRDICVMITARTAITSMAHLTCLGATKKDISNILDDFHRAGITGIMALRGDPPKGQTTFTSDPNGCRYSGELIDIIAEDGRFTIGCAGYPDGHPEAESPKKDWKILNDKFSRGANFAVTQLFFENDSYARMRDHVRKTHPDARIIPGILPITHWEHVRKFSAMCGASVPASLSKLLDPLIKDPVACRRAGMEYTIRQCAELLDKHGAPGLHIYSLNRSTAAAEIVTALRVLGVEI